MDNSNFLLAANMVIWLGIAGYLVFLAGRQKALETRLRRMEALDGRD